MVMATKATPLIAWNTLAEIFVFSLVAGLLIVTLLSIGTQALSQSRRDQSGPVRVAYQGVVAFALLSTAALIGWGLYLVIHKS